MLEILHAEDSKGWNYSVEIKVRFMQSEINKLKKRVERLTKESDKWHSMYVDTFMKYKEAEVCEAFSTFQSLREECETQINSIKVRKRTLRAELKSGCMDNLTYQRTLTPLNKQIKDLVFKVSKKKHELINQFLPKGISYNEMERYMNKKNEI